MKINGIDGNSLFIEDSNGIELKIKGSDNFLLIFDGVIKNDDDNSLSFRFKIKNYDRLDIKNLNKI